MPFYCLELFVIKQKKKFIILLSLPFLHQNKAFWVYTLFANTPVFLKEGCGHGKNSTDSSVLSEEIYAQLKDYSQRIIHTKDDQRRLLQLAFSCEFISYMPWLYTFPNTALLANSAVSS